MVVFRKFDPILHHRRSIRLSGRDYSGNGFYFITICVKHRDACLCGIENGKVQLYEPGSIVSICWQNIPKRYPGVFLDEFIVMPDHFHGIIHVGAVHDGMGHVGAVHEPPLQSGPDVQYDRRNMLIPKIVGWFKMNTARDINKLRNTQGKPFWQRNYYERIIRDQNELNATRRYIRDNS